MSLSIKDYRRLGPRYPSDLGGWWQDVEVGGVAFRVFLRATERVRNPFNGKWGNKWRAYLTSPMEPAVTITSSVVTGTTLPHILYVLGAKFHAERLASKEPTQ